MEHGEPFTEAELLEQMATAFLGLRDSSGDGGRAAYQVSLSVCPRCDAGEWEGGHIATATDIEVARCDAVMKAALEEAPLSCVREATTLYRRVA